MLCVPRLYLLTGIPYAGKSTLGRAIAESCGIEMIDLHIILAEQGVGLQGEWIPESMYASFHQEAERRARHLLSQGKSLVYDVTPFTRCQRERIRSLATDCGAEIHVIFVNASHALVWHRWETETTNPLRHIRVHRENMLYVLSRFESPTQEEHTVFQAGEPIHPWIAKNVPPE